MMHFKLLEWHFT